VEFTEPLFVDAAAKTGLVLHHFAGLSGKYFLPEITGAGVALFDYDRDEDLDVFLVQGAPLGNDKSWDKALNPVPDDQPPGNRLFRNELIPSGKLRFSDVTEGTGLADSGYGMGVAVGDYDNNGTLDLYVTNFGPNTLYRNNGDGTFSDQTDQAGVGDVSWSTGTTFLDYDLDGDLDLYCANYVDFEISSNLKCYDTTGSRDFCDPSVYPPLGDRLYRNDGNGRFTDVTESAGIKALGSGLGVVTADFNSDGWEDIFVANDGEANLLWINGGDGTFEEQALMAGTAYNGEGVAEAGMGVTAADFDDDGDEDLFLTHLANETNTLYLNEGDGNFHDATNAFGLALPSLPYTGFGTKWFDFDNDGRLDLFVINGAVTIEESLRGNPYPFHQRNQLFWNDGQGKYKDVSSSGGPAFRNSKVSRGAALGDIDNDGDLDILVLNNNGLVELLINSCDSKAHWLELRLVTRDGDLEAIGARVALVRKDRTLMWRRVHTDGSFLSASDSRVHFGLGIQPENGCH
jgi:hypothetical protein